MSGTTGRKILLDSSLSSNIKQLLQLGSPKHTRSMYQLSAPQPAGRRPLRPCATSGRSMSSTTNIAGLCSGSVPSSIRRAYLPARQGPGLQRQLSSVYVMERRPDPPTVPRRSIVTFYSKREGEQQPQAFPAGPDMEESSLVRISEDAWNDEASATSSSSSISLDNKISPPRSTVELHESVNMRSILKCCLRHRTLKLLQVLLGFYVAFLTYADIGPPGGLRDQETGLIVDQTSEERTNRGLILVNGTERPIVASTMFQLSCIGFARGAAFFMYPALVMVFFTKFRATTSFLARTPVSLFWNDDLHELHLYCGWTILIFSTIHSGFHLARWAQQGNLYLVWSHRTGLTGLFIVTSMVLICLPMMIYKSKIKYEIRKNVHYFFIFFALCLAFHTSPTAIPNGGFTTMVFGTVLVWWCLDAAYCNFFMTEKIETTKFDVLATGVQLTMPVSAEFQKRGHQGGFCYVCFPWVDKKEWHAFSLFENPTNATERQIFVQKAGDWTTKVHDILQRGTARAVWVQGPFPSPYSSADAYDNHILVATGIGITPALSVIRAHKDTRRINLVWACRDPHLLQFFLRHLYLDHHGWNLIFYTGKEPLQEDEIETFANTNVCIIHGRPKLSTIIPNIIYGIESGKGLPEHYAPEKKTETSELLAEIMLNKKVASGDEANEEGSDVSVSTNQIMVSVSRMAAERGFELEEKLQPMENNASEMETHQRQTEILMDHLRLAFKPWEEEQANRGRESSKVFVRNLDRNMVLSTWGLLYCGGAAVVERELKGISEEYKLDFHMESFGW